MSRKLITGTFFPLLLTAKVYGSGSLSYGYLQSINESQNSSDISASYVDIESSDNVEVRKWDGVYNASLRVYPDSNDLLFSLSEAYFSQNSGRSQYSVGRKILNWNPNEYFWGLGDLNALKGFNLTEQDQEGITAFHFQRESKSGELHLFASFLHIPQMNPTFTNKDGTIEGRNEWSKVPHRFVSYQGNRIPIYYKIQYPTPQEIALQGSVGAMGRFFTKSGDWTVYSTYKPENSIRINATGYYEQFENEQAVVKAKPFITHHFLAGAGWEKEFGSLKAAFNVQTVRPIEASDESFKFEALKVEPVYNKETTATFSLTHQTDTFTISANALSMIEGDVENENDFAVKPEWRQAIGLGYSWKLTDSLSWQGHWRYDLNYLDNITSNTIVWNSSKHTKVSANLLMIDSPDNKSHWAPFRANDSGSIKFSFLY